MISKITKINNIFSFSFFDWDKINRHSFTNKKGENIVADPIFKKNNILFAENGNGKTSLVNIFKNLNGGDVQLEQHWDVKDSLPQEIEILFDDQTLAKFEKNTGWSGVSLKEKVIVFDKSFTESLVHSLGIGAQDTATRKQQRGRNIVYLGNFADYNEEIDKVDGARREIDQRNENFIAKEKQIIASILRDKPVLLEDLARNEIRNQISQSNANKLSEIADELKIKQNELESVKKALDNKTQISTLLELISAGNLPTFDELDPSKAFSFTISAGLQETIDKISEKKSFISTGVQLIQDDTSVCPFCEQSIKNGDFISVIKDYRSIFNTEFENNKRAVLDSLKIYSQALDDLLRYQPPQANYSRLREINKFLTPDESLPEVTLSPEEQEVIKQELTLTRKKQDDAFDSVSGSQFASIVKISNRLNSKKDEYNSSVKRISSKLNDLKTQSEQGTFEGRKQELENQILGLNKELLFIKNNADFLRYFKAISLYEKNKKVVKCLEKIFQQLKSNIVSEFNKFTTEYFGLIKEFVKDISPSMEIFDVHGESTYSRKGRDPVQCGFEVKYNGKTCSDGLSEGERQAIALAFFFAQLKKESNKKDKIVILDDPITSFDAGKRKSTAEIISRETSEFMQSFVMTCDPLFREFCLKEIPNRMFGYIFKTRNSSAIHCVSRARETIYQAFEADFQGIDKENGTNENVVIYGQKLRFCLETKIKEDYFGYSQDNLSNMIEQVAKKGEIGFANLIKNKDIILRLYSYCNTGGLAHYPKDGSTSWNELRAKIDEFLKLNL